MISVFFSQSLRYSWVADSAFFSQGFGLGANFASLGVPSARLLGI